MVNENAWHSPFYTQVVEVYKLQQRFGHTVQSTLYRITQPILLCLNCAPKWGDVCPSTGWCRECGLPILDTIEG